MPKSHEHLDWAEKNEAFAKDFYLQDQIEINWAITVLFYAALHYVDAYLVSRGKPRYDHATREKSMLDPFFDGIRKDYKRLKDMSREARYEIAQYSQADFKRADALLQRIRNHLQPHV